MTSIQGMTEKRILVSPEEQRVIAQLIASAQTTRTSLARDLHVSPAWITKTLTPLITRGIIKEVGAAGRSGGRRARTLGINPDVGYLLGVDFGVTSLDVALSRPDIGLKEHRSISLTVEIGPEACLKAFFRLTDALLSDHQLSPEHIRGIGIGVPGPVDFSCGHLISPPIMPGWDDFPLPEKVMGHFPGAYCVVDNDVNMMALGALCQGAGQGSDNLIFIKIGSGIGAGIVCEGEIYRGSSGCAGDVGHIIVDRQGPLCHCGNYGCVEALAGGMAFARQAQVMAESGQSPLMGKMLDEKPDGLSAVDVGVAAAQGDLNALALIDRNGQYVGEMLTYLVSFFNPDLILIGGGVSKIGHRFLNAIRQVVLKQASPLATRDMRIEYSRLGDRAGLLGALTLAQQYLFCVSDIE